MDRQAHYYAAYAQQQQQQQRQPPPQQQPPPHQQFGYPPQAQQFHGPPFGTPHPPLQQFPYHPAFAAAINDSKLHRTTDDHERFIQTMRAIQGALIVASSIQIILGYSQVWGLFSRFFSPLGMAPVVGLVGLGFFERGFPELGKCVEIGIPMLLLVIGFSQYLKHVRPLRDVPIFEWFPVLICVTIIWIYFLILNVSGAYRDKPNRTQVSCRTDRAN